MKRVLEKYLSVCSLISRCCRPFRTKYLFIIDQMNKKIWSSSFNRVNCKRFYCFSLHHKYNFYLMEKVNRQWNSWWRYLDFVKVTLMTDFRMNYRHLSIWEMRNIKFPWKTIFTYNLNAAAWSSFIFCRHQSLFLTR